VYILGVHAGGHDAAASVFSDYELRSAVQSERLTRNKGQGGWPEAAIDEALSAAGIARSDIGVVVMSRSAILRKFLRLPGHHAVFDWYSRRARGRQHISLSRVLRKLKIADPAAILNRELFLAENGFRPDTAVEFHNHHMAHALSALFFTGWTSALLYTADAAGDNVQYSARIVRDGGMECLFGGEDMLLARPEADSIARAYAFATEALGYRSMRHEGKLTGLAAYGEPALAPRIRALFSVDGRGKICGRFRGNRALRREIFALAEGQPPENVAASIQHVLEELVLDSVRSILARNPVNCLGLAGGVFANVRLNALLKERLGAKEIFICPAMGDEGLAVGGPLAYLLRRDGLNAWMGQRRALSDLYLGRDYDAEIDAVLAAHPGVAKVPDPVGQTAALLQQGRVGALYAGRLEFGPRALGARSILANPADPAINDTLNRRLARTEFMPFAPCVLAERAREIFEIDDANAYACNFMTITTGVKESWKSRIPGVVHVDGTARPQTVRREQNPLYYDILQAFCERTGLPVLINTSFNAHEEPIVNTPRECLRALTENRIDFVTTRQNVYRLDAKAPPAGQR